MTLKILHVYKDFYPPVKGGIENHINMLVKGLKAEGVDVHVLVSNTSNRFKTEIKNGISVAKAPQLGRFYSAPLTPSFHHYLKRYGKTADIIHFHHPNPTAECSYLLSHLKKKLIVTYHSDIIRQDKLGKLYSPFRKWFLSSCHRIIATSPNYIQTSKILNGFKDKCIVIPLGVNIQRFNANGNQQKVKRIKDSYRKQPIILFVGRFRYYKGLHILISAMKNIPAKLLLIGAGPEHARLSALVRENHLENKVLFLGELSDNELNDYYKACDVFVLPSHLRSEAFGLVQLEAMCCGKPVVSTELGTGTSYVNINNKTGIIVPPNDAFALSNAINALLSDPRKRDDFGACGAIRVRRFFTDEQMIRQTLNVYRDLVEKT